MEPSQSLKCPKSLGLGFRFNVSWHTNGWALMCWVEPNEFFSSSLGRWWKLYWSDLFLAPSACQYNREQRNKSENKVETDQIAQHISCSAEDSLPKSHIINSSGWFVCYHNYKQTTHGFDGKQCNCWEGNVPSLEVPKEPGVTTPSVKEEQSWTSFKRSSDRLYVFTAPALLGGIHHLHPTLLLNLKWWRD